MATVCYKETVQACSQRGNSEGEYCNVLVVSSQNVSNEAFLKACNEVF